MVEEQDSASIQARLNPTLLFISKAHGTKAHGTKAHGTKVHGTKAHGTKAHGMPC